MCVLSRKAVITIPVQIDLCNVSEEIQGLEHIVSTHRVSNASDSAEVRVPLV